MSGTLTPSPILFTLTGSAGGTGTLYRGSSGLAQSYATEAELFEYSIPESVSRDFQGMNIALQLRRASREADAMICHRFNTPLALYSEAWVGWICDMASYFLMDVRGYQPGDEGKVEEARFMRKLKRAEGKIKEAQDYLITPDARLLLTEAPQPATPVSFANRGWLRSRVS